MLKIISLTFVLFVFILSGCNVNTQEANKEPVVDAGEDKYTLLNVEVVFRGTAIDTDGFVVLYEWDFDGDEEFDVKSKYPDEVSCVYTTAGIYDVTFRVTDDRGAVVEDHLKVQAGFPEFPEGVLELEEVEIEGSIACAYPACFTTDGTIRMIARDSGNNQVYFFSNDGIYFAPTTGFVVPDEAFENNDLEITMLADGYRGVYSKSEGPDSKIFMIENDFETAGDDWDETELISDGDNSSPSFFSFGDDNYIYFVKNNKDVHMSRYRKDTTPTGGGIKPVSFSPDDKIKNALVVSSIKLLFDGGTYRMWYSATVNGVTSIYYIASSESENWSNSHSRPVEFDTPLDQGCVPVLNAVVFDREEYSYLLYFTCQTNKKLWVAIADCKGE